MSAVPEPRSFSLLITAPDVWVPVVENALESIALGEAASDSVLRAFQEPRPERRYLYESRSDVVSHLELGVGDFFFFFSEFVTSAFNTPLVETGKTESLDFLEDHSEAYNGRFFDGRIERFSVRETEQDRSSSSFGNAEPLSLSEAHTSQHHPAAFTGIEGLVPAEVATLTIGARERRLDTVLVSESQASQLAWVLATSETQILAEVGTISVSASDVVPDAIGAYEEAVSKLSLRASTSELAQITESAESLGTTSFAGAEVGFLFEAWTDRYTKYSEEYVPEALLASEAKTDRYSTLAVRTEALGLAEAKTDTASVSSVRSEVVPFVESRSDGTTSVATDAGTETVAFAEASTSRQGWAVVSTETASLSESKTGEFFGYLQAKSEAIASVESQGSISTWSFPTTEVRSFIELLLDSQAHAVFETLSETLNATEAGSASPGTSDALHEQFEIDPDVRYEMLPLVELWVDQALHFEGQVLSEAGRDWYWPVGTSAQSAAPVITSVSPNPAIVGNTIIVSGTISSQFVELRAETLVWSETYADGPLEALSETISLAEFLPATEAPVITSLTPSTVTVGDTFQVVGTHQMAGIESKSEPLIVSETRTDRLDVSPTLSEAISLVETKTDVASATPTPVISSVSPNPITVGQTLTISGTSSL